MGWRLKPPKRFSERIAGDGMNMYERRSISRTTIYRGAKVFFSPQRGTTDCTVRNITNNGASIRVDGLNILPTNFELSFDNFRSSRKSRLIWRDGAFLGVAFES